MQVTYPGGSCVLLGQGGRVRVAAGVVVVVARVAAGGANDTVYRCYHVTLI